MIVLMNGEKMMYNVFKDIPEVAWQIWDLSEKPTTLILDKPRNVAKNIIATAKIILEEHCGIVPNELEKLVKLPGVGRKTANVVLGNAFNLPGLPVDTHVKRVTNRIGLTKQTDPEKIEYELHQLYQPSEWCLLSHTLIFHGRRICDARNPQCGACSISSFCKSSLEPLSNN